MSVREQVEYQCERLFKRRRIPDSVWNSLKSHPRFRTILDDSREAKEDMKFVRLAYLAEGGMIQREGYLKPTAQARYRRQAQFVANAFRLDVVECVNSSRELQDLIDAGGEVLRFVNHPDSFGIYSGGSEKPVKTFKPDWQKMMSRWNELHPEDKQTVPDTFRTRYRRAVKALGSSPKAALLFDRVARILTARKLLDIHVKFMETFTGQTEADSSPAFYKTVVEPMEKLYRKPIEDYRRLSQALTAQILEPDVEQLGPLYQEAVEALKS